MFLLSACAQGSIYKQFDQDCNDHFYSNKTCPVKKENIQKQERKATNNNYQPQKIRLVAQNEVLPETTQYAQHRVMHQPQPMPVQKPVVVPVETINIQAPAPIVEPRPVIVAGNNCNGCEPIVTQTREPVEVIYKKTTYTTVFEPKTTSTVTYEKEPIVNQKALQVVQPTKVKVVPAEVRVVPVHKNVKTVVTKTKPVVKNNTVSYVIENTRTTAPSELLIEEIK